MDIKRPPNGDEKNEIPAMYAREGQIRSEEKYRLCRRCKKVLKKYQTLYNWQNLAQGYCKEGPVIIK
jgi:hypothetical protein